MRLFLETNDCASVSAELSAFTFTRNNQISGVLQSVETSNRFIEDQYTRIDIYLSSSVLSRIVWISVGAVISDSYADTDTLLYAK